MASVLPTSSVFGDSLAPALVDRDLSWLEFNRRVLAEALDERTPLLERAKFLAIFSSNLDEFFMKRMAILREDGSPRGYKLRAEIRERVLPMLDQQGRQFHQLVPALSQRGVHLRRWNELTDAQRLEANHHFTHHVSPALTPLVISPTQPFPFFSNLSLSLAFVLHDARTDETV